MTAATTRETRTDIHRRGAFQPQFYRFVGWYYLGFRAVNGRCVANASVARCSEALEAFRRSEEAWDFAAVVFGDFGQCAVCGARFAMGEVWQHDETKDMIHIGHECADKYGMLSGTNWTALEDERRRAGLAYKTSLENFAARERIAREHPKFVEALWLADFDRFIADVGRRYMHAPRFLSDRQIDAVERAAVNVWARVERTRARETEQATRNATLTHVGTVGKRETWKGVRLSFVTTYETAYGVTTVCKFEGAGFTLVWKASSTMIRREDMGKVYDVRGTVKEHGDYKGEKQTVLSRCDVNEVQS